jgi:mRNA-degrading endonuclease RelE of RelBE toxin-antitoxin system
MYNIEFTSDAKADLARLAKSEPKAYEKAHYPSLSMLIFKFDFVELKVRKLSITTDYTDYTDFLCL